MSEDKSLAEIQADAYADQVDAENAQVGPAACLREQLQQRRGALQELDILLHLAADGGDLKAALQRRLQHTAAKLDAAQDELTARGESLRENLPPGQPSLTVPRGADALWLWERTGWPE